MHKFKFRFDTVKKVKTTLKQKVQKEFALVNSQIELKQFELKNVLSEINLLQNNKCSKTKLDEIKYLNNYIFSLQKKEKSIRENIRNLETLKKEKIKQIIELKKEEEIFKSLEKSEFAKYIKLQDKLEQKGLDEFSILNYNRINR